MEIQGQTIKLSINGQVVHDVRLNASWTGRVGVNAGRFDGLGEASFDELRATRR